MPKVLIVDDEPDILLVLRINFEAGGYQTALAADGETAMRRIDDEDPDVMVLDVMMPVMDGWRVLETMKNQGMLRPRVIVLSAGYRSPDMIRALELGAVEYLTKPFEPDAVLALVERVIASSPEEIATRRVTRIAELAGSGTP